MLTEMEARKAIAKERDYKLADAGGLHLFVSTTGHRSWRLKYRFGGKERRLVLGSYPEVSLKRARELRDDAKRALREGRDPGLETKRARLSRREGHKNTFEQFAREWHESQVPRWKKVHADDIMCSFERDLFPEIGGYPIDQIDEGLLLHALRKVEARGAIETARRLRQRAERVFRFAAGAGVKNSNPAVNVRDALKPALPGKRWPALTDVEQIRLLIRDVDRAGASPVTRLASRFLALTAQRPGMIRHASWSEIEGVDWARPDGSSPDAVWRIPAPKMKQEMDLREDEAFEHVVPLTTESVEILRAVRPFSSSRGPIFPGGRDITTPLSENAIGYLYNREGWKGRHVPHGWRSSFSTIMNSRMERLSPGSERLLVDRLVIDLMLAHTPSGMSASELRYNRSAYRERRRELAEDWAALILEGADTISLLSSGPRRKMKR